MSLITAADYIYTDVSKISISGSYLPTRQDNAVRGEDIARIREFAAETEIVMGRSNPFRPSTPSHAAVHEIRDLSYLKDWWNSQKTYNYPFPMSGPPNEPFNLTKISSTWNRVSTLNTLHQRILDKRIRTGELVTPSSGDALSKSAVLNLISQCIDMNGAYNYFYHGDGGYKGHMEYDLTDNEGYVQQKDDEPYDSTSLPWASSPRCCIYHRRTSDDSTGVTFTKTASNIAIYPPWFPNDVGRSSLRTLYGHILVAAVKSVGGTYATAQNCALFYSKDVTNRSYQKFMYNEYTINYASLLNQVPSPTGSGNFHEECVFLCGISDIYCGWWLNAHPD